MLKFSDSTRGRILDGLKKYARIVALGRERGMNERDTGDIVRAVLGDMLGYDPFFDVTTEASVRGPNSDFAVLAEGQMQFLICVKPIGIVPNSAHLLRLGGTGAPLYAQWLILTNADIWCCYRLGVGPDRHPELVFRVSLQDGQPLEEKAALFFLLTKEAVQQNALGLYWEQTRVLHPGRLTSLILSEEILQILRREIQRNSTHRVDMHTLRDLLTREVLRPEAVAAHLEKEMAGYDVPQCYAYVRDSNDPTTWRLRYRSPDGLPHPELLTQAVTQLSHGERSIGIPADDIPLVKERLRKAFLELGIPLDDLPAILRTR